MASASISHWVFCSYFYILPETKSTESIIPLLPHDCAIICYASGIVCGHVTDTSQTTYCVILGHTRENFVSTTYFDHFENFFKRWDILMFYSGGINPLLLGRVSVCVLLWNTRRMCRVNKQTLRCDREVYMRTYPHTVTSGFFYKHFTKQTKYPLLMLTLYFKMFF